MNELFDTHIDLCIGHIWYWHILIILNVLNILIISVLQKARIETCYTLVGFHYILIGWVPLHSDWLSSITS